MSKTAWIVFVILTIGVLGGLIALSRGDRVDVSDVDETVAQTASEQNGNIGDHTLGSESPKVTIIEYADFQCPGCASAAPVMKEVVDQTADRGVQLVFRSFPLTTIHPNARAASAAAEAAGLQGKFWEMHDLLFANQDSWSSAGGSERTDTFLNYASQLGLDTEKFEADLTSVDVAAKINFDSALGRKLGVTGTPAIYVNGESVGDKRFEGDTLVEGNEGSLIWSDVDAFIKLIIEPALSSVE